MGMGKRTRDWQPPMWAPTAHLQTAASHPFYRRLNQLPCAHGFDDFAEAQCASFYAATMGRPGLPPGIYSLPDLRELPRHAHPSMLDPSIGSDAAAPPLADREIYEREKLRGSVLVT